MKTPALAVRELELLAGVFRRHPEVERVTLFGSRAKGTHTPRSDVDLAISGSVDPLRAEAIAAELEELPLPYRFEVQSMRHIAHHELLQHIERAGVVVYATPLSAPHPRSDC